MKTKTLIAMFLSGVISLGLAGCNDPIETEPDTVQPDDGNGGTDDGNGNDGTDGNDGGDVIDPSTGTWENNDEDGDGTPDLEDDLPFDPNENSYPEFFEQEPNDNPSIANPVSLEHGFIVNGVISSNLDKGDLFAFEVQDTKFITAIFRTDAQRFSPQVYLSNADGEALESYEMYRSVSPNVVIVNFQIQNAGTYNLSVMDNNYAGGSDLIYNVSVFTDEDVDAFDDMKEYAFGSSLVSQDNDKDGIKDGFEYALMAAPSHIDFDEDGIPNWFDEDADGDGFSDEIEGINDLNNDFFPNYIDRDSDGNNIDDQLESGDPKNPNNFDNDSFIDHLDLDDDNDDILDVYDQKRLEHASRITAIEENGIMLRWTNNVTSTAYTVRDFIRAGDKAELIVSGITEQTQNVVVSYKINGVVTNSKPQITQDQDNNYRLTLEVPNIVGNGYLKVAYEGDYISEEMPFTVHESSLPLLSNEIRTIEEKDLLTLSGDNFDNDTSVFFGSKAAKASLIDENTITVQVPEGITGGSYWVTNTHGASNAVSYILNTNVEFNVTSSNVKEITHIGGILPSHGSAITGNTFEHQVLGSQPEVIYSYTVNQQGERETYLSTLLVPGQRKIEFSDESTASSALVAYLDLMLLGAGIGPQEVLEKVAEFEEYKDYIEQSVAYLEQDSAFFSFTEPRQERIALLNQYGRKILDKVTRPNSAEKHRVAKANGETGATNKFISTNTDTSIEPSIVSYPETNGTWALFDMSMEATTFLENKFVAGHKCGEGVDPKWHEVLNYDGCVELQNRSQLYLSYRVYEVNPMTGNLKDGALNNPLQEHVDTPYHKDMMGPTSGTFLGLEFWSADSLIDKCVYKDCLYQIITPGVDGIYGISPFSLKGTESYNLSGQKAKKMLAIRTIIDNIVIRFYNTLIDAVGIGIPADNATKAKMVRDVIMAVYQHMPAITDQVEALAAKDTVTAQDWEDLAYNIGQELYKKEIQPILTMDMSKLPNIPVGPATQAILSAYEIQMPDFRKALAEKLAKKLFPGWGAIDTAYDASMVASAMIDMAKTLKDMAAVPTKIDYVVSWGLTLSDITPRTIFKDNTQKSFEIVGSGMAVVKGIWDDEPEVIVIDSVTGKELDTDVQYVNKEGTKLTFTLDNIQQIEEAVGPLTVYVRHRGDEAKLGYEILIGSSLSITNVTPNKAPPGTEVTIEGVGFSTKISDNKVTFTGPNDTRISATIVSATTEVLVVKVPNQVQTGFITVEVNGDLSNEYPFFGPSQLEIIFGDNGNFNDDVYKLSVNGAVKYDNSSPKRKVGPVYVSLDEGTHSVELTGIRADDGIGTYYIQFGGDVISVSGDAQSGRDLCPDVVKRYQVEVGQSGTHYHAVTQQVMVKQSEFARSTDDECAAR